MPLPRTSNIVQQLVYIEGQDEPVLMTVDQGAAPGGTRADMRHERQEECNRRHRVRKYREKQAAKEQAALEAHKAEKKAAKKARKAAQRVS